MIEILGTVENNWIGVSYSEELQGYVLHAQVVDWSPSYYSKSILVFGKALNILKERGISHVFALSGDEKKKKMCELFGFKDTGLRVKTELNDNTFLLGLTL